MMGRNAPARLGLFAALAATTIVIYPYRTLVDVDAPQRTVQSAGPLGPLLYMALYAVGTVLFFPGAILPNFPT